MSPRTPSRNGEKIDHDGFEPGLMTFSNAYSACNFIVTWDGEDVRELLAAIKCGRQSGDRFIQDKLIEYILNIPYRHPRPANIPAFIGKPVWAVDKRGRVLIGMPGTEIIVEASELLEQIKKGGGSISNAEALTRAPKSVRKP